MSSSIAFVDQVLTALAIICAAALGLVTLYSSGIDLIDPKVHRASAFALTLLIAVISTRSKRQGQSDTVDMVYLTIDLGLIGLGLWAVWSFLYV